MSSDNNNELFINYQLESIDYYVYPRVRTTVSFKL